MQIHWKDLQGEEIMKKIIFSCIVLLSLPVINCNYTGNSNKDSTNQKTKEPVKINYRESIQSANDPNYFVDEYIFGKLINWEQINEQKISKIKKLIIQIKQNSNLSDVQKKEHYSKNRYIKGTKKELLQFGIVIGVESLLRHYDSYSDKKKKMISDNLCSSINKNLISKINEDMISIKEIRNYVEGGKTTFLYYFRHPRKILKQFANKFCY